MKISKSFKKDLVYIEIAIKKAYPGLMFNLIPAFGKTVRVSWVDGPTVKQMREFWQDSIMPKHDEVKRNFDRVYSLLTVKEYHKLLPSVFKNNTCVTSRESRFGDVGEISMSVGDYNEDKHLLLMEAREKVMSTLYYTSFSARLKKE